MTTSTFGVIMIIIVGLVALGALEGIFAYASSRPLWKTGRAASTEGLYEPVALASAAGQQSVGGHEEQAGRPALAGEQGLVGEQSLVGEQGLAGHGTGAGTPVTVGRSG